MVPQRDNLRVPCIAFIVLDDSCVSDTQYPILHYKRFTDAVQEKGKTYIP